MSGTDKLAELIGSTARDTTSSKETQALTTDTGQSYFTFGNYGLKMLNTRVLVEYQSIGTSFILGSSVSGILGTSGLGLSSVWGNTHYIWGSSIWGGIAGTWNTYSENLVTQPLTTNAIYTIAGWFGGAGGSPPLYAGLGLGKAYMELFANQIYDDTTNTTATWNSTLSFTSGQVAQSLTLPFMDTTITQAKLTSTESSGTFQYFMNADGQTHTDQNGALLSNVVPTLAAVGANITHVAGKIGNAYNFPGEIQIVDSRTGANTLAFGKATTNQKIGQSFVATGCGRIDYIRFKRLANTGSPSANITVRICADSSGSPGSALVSKTIAIADYNSYGTTEGFINLVYTGVAGTTYWVTFESATPSDTNFENITYNSSGSSGVLKQYNGSAWGAVTGSLYFSVVTYDDVDLGADISLPYNSFSIGFWIKTVNTTRRQIISQARTASSGEIEIHSTTGAALTNCLAMENKSNNVTKSTGGVCTALSDTGVWHHYLITNGGTYWTVYQDGLQVYQTTALTDTVAQTYRYIGSGGNSPGGTYSTCMQGGMDDIRFYNVELTAEEALTLGTAGNVTRGLVNKYGFDETAGSKVYDNTKWETVVNGTAHTFINSGTDLRFRINENAASTGVITKVVINDYNTPSTFAQTQTDLDNEYYRVGFDTYDATVDAVLDSQININSTQTALQNIPYQELGSFNTASEGTMFTRYVIPEIILNNVNNYRFTIQTTVSDASSFNSLTTTAGLNKMRDWFYGATTQYPDYIAWGSGSLFDSTMDSAKFDDASAIFDSAAYPTAADTSLPVEQQRNAIGTFRVVNNQVSYEALLTTAQANNVDITRSGIFDASSLGTLWFEQGYISPISKISSFQISEIDQLSLQ